MQTVSRIALLVMSIGLGASCSDDQIDPRDVVLACRDCPPGAVRNGRMFGASVLAAANEHGDVVVESASDRVLWLHPDFSVARESELEIAGIRRLQVDAEAAVVVATGAEIVVLDPDGTERMRVGVSDAPDAIALGPDHVYVAIGPDTLAIGEATFRDAIVALDRTSGQVAWMVAIPPPSLRSDLQLRAAPSGELLVAGGFRGTLALGGTAPPLVSPNDAGFIAKLDPAGQGQWARALSTTGEEDRARVTAIARSTAGDVAIVGSWTGPQVTLAGTTVEAGNTSDPELVAELAADGTLRRANRIEVDHISWWSSIATDGMATVVAEDRNSGRVALLGPDGWTSSCAVDAFNALHAKVLAVTEVGVIVTLRVTLSGFEERPPLLRCGDVEYRGPTIAALVELVR